MRYHTPSVLIRQLLATSKYITKYEIGGKERKKTDFIPAQVIHQTFFFRTAEVMSIGLPIC
jgi:hypothetical protein